MSGISHQPKARKPRRKTLPIFLIPTLAAALFSSGCVTSVADSAARRLNRQAEASGSPYRYRAQSVAGGSVLEKYRTVPPEPGPIPANLQRTDFPPELQRDILAKIDVVQRGWGAGAGPVLLGVSPAVQVSGSVKEVWFVKQGDGAVRYEVTTRPSAKDGTDFTLTGPLD